MILRHVHNSALQAFTSSHRLTPHLLLLIVTGSMIYVHTLTLPTRLDDYEHEPCQQVLNDANYIFVPPVSAAQRRANKVHTVATPGVTDKAMTYIQAMAHPEAPGLKSALLDELKSLSPSEHNTWVEFLGREKDIPKGRLISSKAIFSIVYIPDGSFKSIKLASSLVAICSSQNRKILTPVQSHLRRHGFYSVLSLSMI